MNIYKLFRINVKNTLSELKNKFIMKGKTVIKFENSGCMGEKHVFDYIGTIVGTTYPKYADGNMFYKVLVLKNRCGYELRDTNEKLYEQVPSWYLQNIGGDFYVVYS